MTLLFLLACTGDTTSSDSALPTEGTLALSFLMDDDWIVSMDEEPIGTFYGSFWYGYDVEVTGPVEGAESLGEIEVENVDLRDGGGPTAVLFTSGPLPAEEIVVLGFLDSDNNAVAGDEGPETGDPVTLPADNDFDVVAGAETAVEIYFDFLNP
jgi:hypothetical protein